LLYVLSLRGIPITMELEPYILKTYYDKKTKTMIKEKQTWLGQSLDGPTILYYRNGFARVASNFKNGRLHGKQVYYYKTGELWRIYNYVDGVIQDDTYYEFFTDGQISSIYTFIDGKMEGQYVEFHTNWRIKCEGIFINNYRRGKFYTYDEDGNVLSSIDYD